jgi:hypothetical protein
MQHRDPVLPRHLDGRFHARVSASRCVVIRALGLSACLSLISSGCSLGEAIHETEIRDPLPSIPHVEVKVMKHGRIDFMPSAKRLKGVVLAAPHGTFDEYTGELVRYISHQTGMAGVVASGFTPSETFGWRINVNRPSERHYPGGSIEIGSARSKAVYEVFRETVLKASQGELKLHVDFHQNGTQRDIEVATTGISPDEAQIIKQIYHEARDFVLRKGSAVAAVDLRIEPIDGIEIGAWAAKAGGILGVAKKSLHFELPLYGTLATAAARDAYARILVRLLTAASALLVRSEKSFSDTGGLAVQLAAQRGLRRLPWVGLDNG